MTNNGCIQIYSGDIDLTGKRIIMTSDGFYVDGKQIVEFNESETPVLKIEITGNVESLITEDSDVTVNGRVGSVVAKNGNTECQTVERNVDSKNGNVYCGKVMGNCYAKNGNIYCNR